MRKDCTPLLRSLALLCTCGEGGPIAAADFRPNFPEVLAHDTGVKAITTHHGDSLTGGPPAGTGVNQMRYHVARIASSLR